MFEKEVVDFIRTLYKTAEAVPLHEPRFGGNEKRYVNTAIDSTFVSSIGQFVDRFEQMFAEFVGAGYAVAMVNGTAALHIALQLAGVGRGDEVITQPLSFIATCCAIHYCGATPVFVDVDRDTLGLSPRKMAQWLEKNTRVSNNTCSNVHTGRKIAACVPMHTFGHPAKIEEIKQLCDQYRLALVEDAAESLGSYYRARHTGTFGKCAAFSFNGNKTITTGGGGMLVTDDAHLAAEAKHLTTTAKLPHRWEYVHDRIAFNYRMPNLNAALGCAQLEQLPRFLQRKRNLARQYQSFFAGKAAFVTEPENATSNYWLNAIALENQAQRDHFLTCTNDSGIATRPVWRLLSSLPVFAGCQCGDLSNARWLEQRIANLPSSVILE